MSTSTKPHLLLDVDGVLAPSFDGEPSAGFDLHSVVSKADTTHEVWLNRAHGAWIQQLSSVFEVGWATGWQEDAKRLLEPFFDVGPFDFIRFSEEPRIGQRIEKIADTIGTSLSVRSPGSTTNWMKRNTSGRPTGKRRRCSSSRTH